MTLVACTLRGTAHGPGTPYRIKKSSNLWTVPDLRANDTDVPGSHGIVAGVDLEGARRVTVIAQITELSAPEALARRHELVAAWAPGSVDELLYVTDASGEYVLFGRPRQAAPLMENLPAGIIDAECRFVATDPHLYSAAEKQQATGAPVPPGGFTFPIVFPLVFAGGGGGGTLQIDNEGTAPTSRWQATFIGPCSEPRLSLAGQGVTYGGDLLAGQTLVVDGRNRTALLQGTSTVFGLLSERNWFALPPGPSELQFSSADGQGSVSFSYRDAWW